MVAELYVMIAGFVVVLGVVLASKVGLERYFDAKYEELSQELAQAVLKVAEMGANINIDPPNPMQQMLMGLVQQKIEQNRGENGQFVTENI
jgi:hypothetical protein